MLDQSPAEVDQCCHQYEATIREANPCVSTALCNEKGEPDAMRPRVPIARRLAPFRQS